MRSKSSARSLAAADAPSSVSRRTRPSSRGLRQHWMSAGKLALSTSLLMTLTVGELNSALALEAPVSSMTSSSSTSTTGATAVTLPTSTTTTTATSVEATPRTSTTVTTHPTATLTPPTTGPVPSPAPQTATVKIDAPVTVAPSSSPGPPPTARPASPDVPRTAPPSTRSAKGAPDVTSQVTRLLRAAAAARDQLSVQVAEAEAALAQREAEHTAAEANRRALEAQETEVRAAVTIARAGFDEIDGTIPRLATAADAAAVVVRRRTTPVGHPPAPGRTPKDDAERARSALTDATRSRHEALQKLRVSELDLELRATRAADGRQVAAAAAKELEQRRNALAGLRRQLDAVGSSATTGGFAARVLSTESSGAPSPTALALSDVPPQYLDLYRRHAPSCPGLSWTVLAAIGSIESSHGRSTAPGVSQGANFAGAMGPMQFLGATWDAYGVDGNDDGVRDVYHPADAVAGAANYLCVNGAGRLASLAGAIWNYNHADWYVAAVIQLAVAYGGGSFAQAGASATVEELVSNPNLTLSPDARADLLGGGADERLVELLGVLTANHRITVSVIKTGHSQFVSGTNRVSNHFHGRGIDIAEVDGAPVTPSSSAALELSLAILTAEPPIRPNEFGSPWPELSRFPGGFSDADHANHLHLGWSVN